MRRRRSEESDPTRRCWAHYRARPSRASAVRPSWSAAPLRRSIASACATMARRLPSTNAIRSGCSGTSADTRPRRRRQWKMHARTRLQWTRLRPDQSRAWRWLFLVAWREAWRLHRIEARDADRTAGLAALERLEDRRLDPEPSVASRDALARLRPRQRRVLPPHGGGPRPWKGCPAARGAPRPADPPP